MIKIDYGKSKELSEAVHRYYYTPRKELHLTDDPKINCPLKTYCRMKGIKPEISRKTIAIFLMGRVFGAMLEEAYKEGCYGRSTEIFTQQEFKLGVSVGHPDIMDGGAPIELKHTRRAILNAEDIPKKWIRQLKLECIYSKSRIGYLGILSLDTALTTVWKLNFKGSEYGHLMNKHMKDMDDLNNIIGLDTPEKLKPVREECRTCFYNYEEGCPKAPKRKKLNE